MFFDQSSSCRFSVIHQLGSGQGSPEEQDVGLGLVGHVVDPALALLDPERPPLRLGHEVRPRHHLRQVFRQHHVPVLVLVVEVLVRVVDVFVGHSVSVK